jgi:hypothetical protein
MNVKNGTRSNPKMIDLVTEQPKGQPELAKHVKLTAYHFLKFECCTLKFDFCM